MSDPTIRIGQHETIAVVRAVLPVGTHVFNVHTAGNSVLSSAYVKSGAGSAQVNWYDYHSSNGEEFAARYDLAAHPVLIVGQKSRLIVTHIHNNARVEVIVSGAPAEVMVLATLVADFPVELEGKLDGATANVLQDEGIPISVYDPVDGKFYLLRGDDGQLFVTEAGAEFHAFARVNTVPNAFTDILSFTVPAGVTRKVKAVGASCSVTGAWELTVDGTVVRDGYTAPGHPDSDKKIDPKLSIPSGALVKVRFKARAGSPIVTVSGHVDALDLT